MKLLNTVAATTFCAVALTATMASGAAAAMPAHAADGLDVAPSSAATIEMIPGCASDDVQVESCSVSMESASSAGEAVDATQLSDETLDLESADGVTVREASTRSTIYTKTWNQTKRGLYYFNWSEKHSGRIYYDGLHVWSTTSSAGYKGSHTCDQGSAIFYSVKVTKCSTERLGTSSLNEWDYYQVHVVASGIPLYTSQNQHMHATNKGAISWY